MKVWWCEEHKNTGIHREIDPEIDRDDVVCAVWSEKVANDYEYGSSYFREVIVPCRMVEMQLVPADARIVSGDALVVEKVEGEWPKRVLEILQYDVAMLAEAEPAEILDALAQVGGE